MAGSPPVSDAFGPGVSSGLGSTLGSVSSTVTVLQTAYDIGKIVGGWFFGGGKKVAQPAPLPSWAQQGTPAYGAWSYQNVPPKRLVYIDQQTGGHRLFGPSQAAALIMAELPPLPLGTVVTLDPATSKTGVLNKAAMDRALKGCPSAPANTTAPPAAPPLTPAAPAQTDPTWQQLGQLLELGSQFPRSFPPGAVDAFNERFIRPHLSRPHLPGLSPPPTPPEFRRGGNMEDFPLDPLDPPAPDQSDAVPPAPAPAQPCGCVMPCCPGAAGDGGRKSRPRSKPRLRPNVTIICGGRKRKL